MNGIQVDPAKVLELQHLQAEQNRRSAYEKEADPLYFKSQRGEATTQEWLDKVAEIKARYPMG